MLFLCICGAGCLGILGIISPFLQKIIASSHDKPYSEDTEPINNDCFICLERISNEVVATCNHSFCGKDSFIKDSALPIIYGPTKTAQLTVQPAEKRSLFSLGDSKPTQSSRNK
jgi:hypothetical protein